MKLLRPIAGLLTAAGLVVTPVAGAPIGAMAFTPDGSALLVAAGGTLRIHPADSAASQRELRTSLLRIQDLAFSPDGRLLAVSGGFPGTSGETQLLSWPDGGPVSRFAGFKDVATAAAFQRQGEQIAIASADRSVVVCSLQGDQINTNTIHRLVNHSRAVLDVAYGPEGRFLVTASADRSLKVWDAPSGRLIRSLGNHTEIVNALAMRPPVRFGDQVLPFYCASASDDRTVRIWQPGIGRMVRIVRYHDAEINAVAWHPGGDRLYSADRAGVVRVIDAASDRVLGQWQAHDDWIYHLVINEEGTRLATGDWQGIVKIWEERDGQATLIRTLTDR